MKNSWFEYYVLYIPIAYVIGNISVQYDANWVIGIDAASNLKWDFQILSK